ncbi:hypothetical protein BMJ34_06045 [Sinorhizobium medicae]|uniref:Uncharacterized protein n=1 Tax=Sinorhizobium medicae TaxID=110321 RepID=A0A508X6E1_9HYPH|nr:hypothetical protein [Sinorhizobium medicae]PLU06559.1 hypothetical protein BMJ33_06160 [Sinorhizobium medicae]PLU06844.1 hypothetical protein BMJ34_06045 [Sinorhizobium medicae]PLU11753.1 hypothetical protein BMJ30_29010 [Sinorhizobium medicae]PLU18314.1 hypothetical protein BMJ29_19065 [Sinorhizobium medicae]PLU29381.1 hypothetical protein BMJ27_27585 [Sinorhizobium medicae]
MLEDASVSVPVQFLLVYLEIIVINRHGGVVVAAGQPVVLINRRGDIDVTNLLGRLLFLPPPFQIVLAEACRPLLIKIQPPAQLVERRYVDLANSLLYPESHLMGVLRPLHGGEIDFASRSLGSVFFDVSRRLLLRWP